MLVRFLELVLGMMDEDHMNPYENSTNFSEIFRDSANSLGIELLGVTSARPFRAAEKIARKRLNDGLMGELKWYNERRIFRGTRPQELLSDAKSIVSVAMNYLPNPKMDEIVQSGHGRVARYARGIDYHKVMKKRLRELMDIFSSRIEKTIKYKVYVDDGPMLDREVARRSGLGFYGKNTNILTKFGSWVFLGQVLLDLELRVDKSSGKSCGVCTDCIPVCPTGAIIAPYVIDSNRCISYLTIEHRGSIPRHLRPLIGDMVFGCDLCQEVCPVNRKRGTVTGHIEFRSSEHDAGINLEEILLMDEEAFQQRFQNSPVRRATRTGLQRNACIVLGNSKNPEAIVPLTHALSNEDYLVREHAAWALGQVGGKAAKESLEAALDLESNATVKDEISEALGILINEIAPRKKVLVKKKPQS